MQGGLPMAALHQCQIWLPRASGDYTDRGRRCYMCSNNAFPCLFALNGCQNHVRLIQRGSAPVLRSCLSYKKKRCPHDPATAATCRSIGCSVQVSVGNSFCALCVEGKVPCSNFCLRRCEDAGLRMCVLCAGPTAMSGSGRLPESRRSDAVQTPPSAGSGPECTSSATPHNPPLQPHAPIKNTSAQRLADRSHDVTTLWPHVPHHVCHNFPFCHKQQKRTRISKGPREKWCASCTKNLAAGHRCRHPGCTAPVAPREIVFLVVGQEGLTRSLSVASDA